MPDITASRPIAGAPIETGWGDEVHDQIEGIQTGRGTVVWSGTDLSNVVSVTFPRAYASAPIVMIAAEGGALYNVNLTGAPTTTGFAVAGHRTNNGSASVSISFTWVAIGIPA